MATKPRPTDLWKCELISQKQEAWGDRCVYRVPEELIQKSRKDWRDPKSEAECIFK